MIAIILLTFLIYALCDYKLPIELPIPPTGSTSITDQNSQSCKSTCL